ncbi:MAG: hypothetical protein FJ088_02125 [Deltaproteobacteria bacterium]|nr:hypothetical protein [Deltaproteobacteria bacterium]
MKFLFIIYSSVLFLILAISAVVLHFSEPPGFTKYESDGFSCEVPEGSEHSDAQENGWHKHIFKGYGDLYISHARFGTNFQAVLMDFQERFFNRTAFSQDIKVFENGKFFLNKRGKTRSYIYVFSVGDEVFWVEMFAKHSTLQAYKEIADNVVKTFKYGSLASNASLADDIEAINKKIEIHSQSYPMFFAMMITIPLIVFAVSFAIFYFVGRMPAEAFKLKALYRKSHLFVNVKRRWYMNRGTPGALVVTDQFLKIYVMGREKCSIERADFDKVSAKGSFFGKYLEFPYQQATVKVYTHDADQIVRDIRSASQI